jgi:hemolysin activation/secretion protein
MIELQLISRIRRQTIVFVLLLLFAPSLVSAAPTINRTDTEEQNRRSRQEANEKRQREQQSDVFLQKKRISAEEATLPEETPAFVINALNLEGKEVERFPWAKDMLARYSGRSIGKEGINLIVRRVTNAFIDRGYITTRIVVPEQDLSGGVLRLVLVPGVIGEIYIKSANYRGGWQTAFPVRSGDLLNLRDLEQGLEQMKRVPSQEVDMQLVPGKQPGESDIAITVKEGNPLKVVLSLDDSGSKGTGRLQWSTAVSFDNLFGSNDLFNVSFTHDADRESQLRGTRGPSLTYSFPKGNWTYTLSARENYYHQTIAGYSQTFVYSGKSDSLEFRAQRLLHRDQTSKTHMQLSITKGHSKSFIDDTEIEVQRKDTTAAEVALQHRHYFDKTILDVEVAHKRGVPWFNAQPEPDIADTATTHFRLWTFNTSVSTPLEIGSIQGRYSLQLRAQTTKSTLYASEFFSIGNRYTVRGFDGEQTLAAERGWFIRNEIAVPVGKASLEVYAGLDYGKVSGPSAHYLSGRSISGAAIGFRGEFAKIQYDVFVGWPLKKPQELKTASPTYGFYAIHQI